MSNLGARMLREHEWGFAAQIAKQDVELTRALYFKRYANGSEASLDTAHAAELSYAETLAQLGKRWRDAGILAMAAESYMNLFPWDYYTQVSQLQADTCVQVHIHLSSDFTGSAISKEHPQCDPCPARADSSAER